MKKYFSLFLILIITCSGFSQNITNVDAQQIGNKIEITYNLDKETNIEVFISENGGTSYSSITKVTGDVGKNITAGNKKMVWDVLAERDKLQGDNIVFKVKASGGKVSSIEMVFVKGGTFTMGCTKEQGSDCEAFEEPAHSVILSDYYIGKYPVTQAQWKAVMDSYPSELHNTGCDECPVEKVSWHDAQDFIKELNAQTGKNYRLPTEAEWEFAARGGNQSKRYKYSGSNSIIDVAWYDENFNNSKHGSQGTTHPVGTKAPNELYIYDMSGNVYEWCSDWFEFYFSILQINSEEPIFIPMRVLRGGSWGNIAQNCRVSARYGNPPDSRYGIHGFRLASSTE